MGSSSNRGTQINESFNLDYAAHADLRTIPSPATLKDTMGARVLAGRVQQGRIILESDEALPEGAVVSIAVSSVADESVEVDAELARELEDRMDEYDRDPSKVVPLAQVLASLQRP